MYCYTVVAAALFYWAQREQPNKLSKAQRCVLIYNIMKAINTIDSTRTVSVCMVALLHPHHIIYIYLLPCTHTHIIHTIASTMAW